MSYFKQLEKITHRGMVWYRILDDSAFIDVMDGFLDKGEEIYLQHTKNRNVCVQAGGYCGIFARFLSEHFQTVYTFEPDPLNFFCLTQNCQIDNVIKCQGALGNKTNLVSVARPIPTNKGMHYVYNANDSTIPTYKIDDLGLHTCDLMILDTEGYEMNILLGAEKTIDTFRPTISVEDSNKYIEEFLASFDYKKVDEVYRDTIYAYVQHQ